ncbi:MAG: hypothetical protein F6K03_13400 [Kamptonema sp. SIO4C4]|nr:hypothetical protein [Kamptonema sp. SIO4C4]
MKCPNLPRITLKSTTLDRLYQQNFGQNDYTEIQKIKLWLDQHPQREALLGYLLNETPYQLESVLNHAP